MDIGMSTVGLWRIKPTSLYLLYYSYGHNINKMGIECPSSLFFLLSTMMSFSWQMLAKELIKRGPIIPKYALSPKVCWPVGHHLDIV